jgi:hypothetical protein
MAILLLLGSLLTFRCCCSSGQLLTCWHGLLYALFQECCLLVPVKLLLLLIVVVLLPLCCLCVSTVFIHGLHAGLACIWVRLEGLCSSSPPLMLLSSLLPCSPGPAAAATALRCLSGGLLWFPGGLPAFGCLAACCCKRLIHLLNMFIVHTH